jgi:uncharacterized protein (TIRG00374 family)
MVARYQPLVEDNVSRLRHRISIAASVMVSVGALFLLFRHIPGRDVLAVIERVQWSHLLAAAFLALGIWFLMAWKWYVLAARDGLAWRRVLELSFRAQLYGFVLPGQIAGDAFRAIALRRDHGGAYALITVLLDRLLGLVALLALGAAGAFVSARLGSFEAARSIRWMLSAGTLATLAMGLTLLLGARQFALPAWVGEGVRKRLESLRQAVDHVGRRRCLSGLLLSLLSQLVCVLLVSEFAASIGVPIALADCAWVFALVSVALIVPFSIGGLGIREGTLVGVLALIGVAPQQALALSFLLYAQAAFGAFLGLVWEIASYRRRRRSAGHDSPSDPAPPVTG